MIEIFNTLISAYFALHIYVFNYLYKKSIW